MLKKFCLILLLLCFVLCGCQKIENSNDLLTEIVKRDKLIVGVRTDTAPFGFLNEKGEHDGYDIDLAKRIAKVILDDENKVEYVPVTASNRILKLNSGEVDMLIATMSVTAQRQFVVDFSVPYYIAGQAIMVNSDNKATRLRDFEGKKVIIIFGSTSEGNIGKNIRDVEVMGFKTYKEAFKALKERKADCIVADDTVLMGYAIKDNSVKLLPKRYSEEPYAVALRQGEETKRLMSKVNYIIDNLQQTRQLFRMQEKWGIKE